MSVIKPVSEDTATGRVKEIYEEIKKGFNIPFVPNLFKMMAHNPDYLNNMWERVQVIMSPGKLDKKTKEIIALAVNVNTPTPNNIPWSVDITLTAPSGSQFVTQSSGLWAVPGKFGAGGEGLADNSFPPFGAFDLPGFGNGENNFPLE
ncbi:MAG: hypothetical protein ACE5EA_09990 [Nitrospirota bacterium]